MRAGSNPGLASTFLTLCVIGSEGFLISLPRLSTTAASTTPTGHQRCKVTRLSLTPPRKSRSGAGAGSAAAGGDDGGQASRFGGTDDILKTSSSMTRAPLRITPNFQPRDERRPSADMDRDIAYGAFLAEEGLDIAAMAWEEFSDFVRRTVERNVNGPQFQFDIRQWSSSIRKWWSRAVEMDVQAKADLLRLYYSSVGQRDAWGNQAAKVDARVEDEWDSIYVDCHDGADVDSQDYTFDRGSGNTFSSMNDGVEIMGLGRNGESSSSGVSAVESLSQARTGDGRWRANSGGSNNGGSRSALMAAMDAFQADEEEVRGGQGLRGMSEEEEEVDEEEEENSDDDEEEEIIDCAIKGRWTFTNDDDPPHFLPQ